MRGRGKTGRWEGRVERDRGAEGMETWRERRSSVTYTQQCGKDIATFTHSPDNPTIIILTIQIHSAVE